MLALAAALALQAAAAPPPKPIPAPSSPNVKKVTLQTLEFPGHGEHTVLVKTSVDPRHEVAAHIHPGIEMCYVLSGAVRVKMTGAPEIKLKAGDSIAIPPRTVHAMANAGIGPLVLLSTYVVDAKQPIAQVPPPPAAAPPPTSLPTPK